MKKFLAILLVAMLVIPTAFILSASAEDTYDKTMSTDEKGTVSFGNAYGYTFNIGSINGVIGGEDSTIITTAEAYSACNPNWAISVHMKKLADNKYEVIKVVVTPGAADKAGITFAEGDIVMVIHSATSQPDVVNEKTGELNKVNYPNWEQKVAAIALKAGDVVTLSGIDLSAGTSTEGKAYVAVPGADETSEPVVDVTSTFNDETAVDDSSAAGETSSTAPAASSTDTTSIPKTGDDGISMLVFAVIALVAVVGTAVVIKTRR